MDYEKKYNEALKWMRELYPRFPGAFKEEVEHYFPELRESEDEQSYKKIEQLIRLNTSGAEKTRLLAYLEKQKEQKPVNWTELTWKDIVELEGIINNVHYDFSAGIGQESFGKEVLERFRNKKDDAEVDTCEQKPSWSEEDKRIANALILELKTNPSVATTNGYKRTDYIDWINNLCPSWKPSEEQMEALNKARRFIPYNCDILESLYENLKRL